MKKISTAPIFIESGSTGHFTITLATLAYLHTQTHYLRMTEAKTAVTKTDRLETVFEKVGFKSGFE